MKKVLLGTFSLIALAGCSHQVPSSTSLFSSLPEGITLIDEVRAF